MVLGATNRPNDIDAAILRRMPKRYAVHLPDAPQREKILKIMLKDSKLDAKKFKLADIVKRSAGLSGSDLKELCRNAAMIPVREYLRSKEGIASMKLARSQNLSGSGAGGSGTPSSVGEGGGGGAAAIDGLNGSSTHAALNGGSLGGKSMMLRPLRTDDFFRTDAEVHIPMGSYNSQGARKVTSADTEPLD